MYIKTYDLPNSQYLFYNFSTGQPFTGQAIRKMKAEIEKLSGVNFKLKDFRATYVTLTVQDDMDRLKKLPSSSGTRASKPPRDTISASEE